MELFLVLPGLLAARDTGALPQHAPALARLVALAASPMYEPEGSDAALASHYGIVRQADWPLAALRAAALGLETGADYWIAADPVTLSVGRDDAAFVGVVGDLDRAEADALAAALNAHFADDGLTFVAPRPDALFARRASAPRVSTHPPTPTADRPLRLRLPEGPDAPLWRRWQSEIQMLLHEHPVNARREREGRPAANSVWFSGGGTLPPRPASGPTICTFADSGIAVALALHAGSPARAVPAGAAEALALAAGAERVVVALPTKLPGATLEAQWAAPAWRALAAGRLDAVTLIADDEGAAVIWRAPKPTLRQRLAGRVARHDLAALVAAARRRE